MFGLVRTAVLVGLAFLGGLFFERNQAAEACTVAGGTHAGGICHGAAQ